MLQASLNGITITLLVTDITTIPVDVLVYSATADKDMTDSIGASLLRRGGTAFQRATAGVTFQAEGEVALADAGELPAKIVIFAFGPTIGSGGERGKLASTVWKTLQLAESRHYASIAFPPIAIGRQGYPIEGCANVMAQKIADFTFEDVSFLKNIFVALPENTIYETFRRAFSSEIDDATAEVSH